MRIGDKISLRPSAIPRKYIPRNAKFKIIGISDYGMVFLRWEGVEFFVHKSDITSTFIFR